MCSRGAEEGRGREGGREGWEGRREGGEGREGGREGEREGVRGKGRGEGGWQHLGTAVHLSSSSEMGRQASLDGLWCTVWGCEGGGGGGEAGRVCVDTLESSTGMPGRLAGWTERQRRCNYTQSSSVIQEGETH